MIPICVQYSFTKAGFVRGLSNPISRGEHYFAESGWSSNIDSRSFVTEAKETALDGPQRYGPGRGSEQARAKVLVR